MLSLYFLLFVVATKINVISVIRTQATSFPARPPEPLTVHSLKSPIVMSQVWGWRDYIMSFNPDNLKCAGDTGENKFLAPVSLNSERIKTPIQGLMGLPVHLHLP